MAMPAFDPMGQLIEGWKATQLTDYLHASGITMLVVDYLQTMPDEVQLMWPSAPFSLPRFLFFALRYGVFAQCGIAFYYVRLNEVTAAHCHWVFFSVVMASCVILLASEAVLFVRLYAFSGRRRGMMIYLVAQFLVLAGSKFTLLTAFGKDVLYVDGLPIPICLPIRLRANLLGGAYVLTFSNLLTVMLLMVYIARSKHKGLNSTLFAVFYRDGLLYFACLSVFAIFNGIMGFIAPVRYKFLFIQMETELHAILATRMLLHLRRQGRRTIIGVDTRTGCLHDLSDIVAADLQLHFGGGGQNRINGVQVMVETYAS